MEDTSFQGLLRNAFQYETSTLYTSIPCVVLGVTNGLEECMVDVQPSISNLYRDGEVEEHPPILAVPVIFPASLTSAFTFPVNVGDTVLCVFSQRGIDNFKQGNGSPTRPTDYRKFDKRDAVAIPGLFPFNSSINKPSKRTWAHNTQDAVVAHNIGTGNEVEIRLKASGDVIVNTNKDVTVNCNAATVNAASGTFNIPNSVWTGNITYTGDITYNGNIDHNGIYTLDGHNLNTHVHTGVSAGPSNTGPMA